MSYKKVISMDIDIQINWKVFYLNKILLFIHKINWENIKWN